ncbi:hypothetical protein RB195_006214 [Necator americanus]|uniref:Reverse transcriptase domain-containing protein n=1 Tax=Necator americanus TaxID=51031 RepID=A0ABR1BUH8_NECAM
MIKISNKLNSRARVGQPARGPAETLRSICASSQPTANRSTQQTDAILPSKVDELDLQETHHVVSRKELTSSYGNGQPPAMENLSLLLTSHIAKARNRKGQVPEGSMEPLATTIRFITLNCRTLSREPQQAALSILLRYLCVPFAALQETRMRDRPIISIENYTICCGDADEKKCAFVRLDHRGRKLWIVSAQTPMETAEDNNANAKMGLEQQTDVLGKWYYPAERTSENEHYPGPLIKHREETTRDEQAGFRPGRSTIDQVFIVRRLIEIWQRYSNPMHIAFLNFAAFDSLHRCRLLNALRADGIPGEFVRLLDDMNQRTTAAVRTPA